MYHRNKVHTDEFWKYEMAKHRRTVVDDKDRNDDMWQQQLGKHGKDVMIKSAASCHNGSIYGGESMHLSKTDPSHDERWLQQIKRATSNESYDKPQPLTDVKLLALQSLQSSLHSLKSNMYPNENAKDEKHVRVLSRDSSSFTPNPQGMLMKEEAMEIDAQQPSNKPPKHVKSQPMAETRLPCTLNKTSQEQDDNYLTLLAHLSAQRKACEEQNFPNSLPIEKATDVSLEMDESVISRDKSNIQYQEPSQRSESFCSRQRAIGQDQRSSSNSPPTLSLPDIKEESSVTRTKMWLAQLGQYRQKAVQDEMEKSHDELWEEQISRGKSSTVKSPIEPLEITIEDEGRSTKNSTSSVSTPRRSFKQEKHPPLISALQVQPAPTRANPQISKYNFTRNSYDVDEEPANMPNNKMPSAPCSKSKMNSWTNNNSPSLSPRSSIEKMTSPRPTASPIASNPRPKDSVSFKNLLSINSSIIVNINGQNVDMRGSSVDKNDGKTEESLSSKSFSGRIALSTPIEANNNDTRISRRQEEQANSDEFATHSRHIPLAIPPLQPSSHLPPIAKYKSEKLSNVHEGKVEDSHSMDMVATKKVEDNQKSKPKYPPPDPSTFGSSSVLKMLLMDPSARKRPSSPPPSPVPNKKNAPSNTSLESLQNNSVADKSGENVFKKFYGAPNTCDETDILRRRLLGIKESASQVTTQQKSVKMLLPKPRYSPPSATITSADIAAKEPAMFHKKSPMAVEEFTKVAAAAATLASFNLSRLDEKQPNQQNLEKSRTTKKVNFPIEVNYETYSQQESPLAAQRYQILLPMTQQHPLLLDDDLKNSENSVVPISKQLDNTNNPNHDTKSIATESVRQEGNPSSPYRKSLESDHNDSIEKKSKIGLEEANISAYARTSVSKQLLYRYTTHNNNNINNNNDDTYNHPVRRTSQ